MVACIRQATSTASSLCFSSALRAAVVLLSGSVGTGPSKIYSFFAILRTILRLRCHSRKLVLFSFSFSSIDLRTKELFSLDICYISKEILISIFDVYFLI
ncbi:hypothetical protein Hanom_Chr09g00814981 [Helianthus anomalus]